MRGARGGPCTLEAALHEMNDSLCARYPGLTPFTLRRESAGEVLKLVRRVNASTPAPAAGGGRRKVGMDTATGGWY